MCSDPNHVKDFRTLTEAVIRMETKLDNVLSVVNDHEARLRVAEAAIIVHKEAESDREGHDGRLKTLENITRDLDTTISALKKILWAVVLSVAAGVGVIIVDIYKKGV